MSRILKLPERGFDLKNLGENLLYTQGEDVRDAEAKQHSDTIHLNKEQFIKQIGEPHLDKDGMTRLMEKFGFGHDLDDVWSDEWLGEVNSNPMGRDGCLTSKWAPSEARLEVRIYFLFRPDFS